MLSQRHCTLRAIRTALRPTRSRRWRRSGSRERPAAARRGRRPWECVSLGWLGSCQAQLWSCAQARCRYVVAPESPQPLDRALSYFFQMPWADKTPPRASHTATLLYNLDTEAEALAARCYLQRRGKGVAGARHGRRQRMHEYTLRLQLARAGSHTPRARRRQRTLGPAGRAEIIWRAQITCQTACQIT